MRKALSGNPAGDAIEIEGLGAAFLSEACVEGSPVLALMTFKEVQRQCDERVEEIVEFIFVAKVGPYLFANGSDCGSIDLSRLVGKAAAQGRGAGAPLFEARFVKESIGICVEQFVGEDGWSWSVDCKAADGSLLDAAQEIDKTFEVHRFL